MKYMVMETHLSYAIVLDEEGRFKKVANLNYEVGQKIDNIYELSEPKKEFYISKQMFAGLATLAAVFVFAFSFMLNMPITPYASIYMSINPEVKIDIDKKSKVINLTGMNKDGENLILNYNYKNKELEKVSDELIDKAIEMGYLYDGKTISITFDGKDTKWINETKEKYSNHLNNYLKDKVSITIKFDNDDSYEIIIPVNNQYDDNHYGDSDYDETDYDESEYDIDDESDYDDINHDSNNENITDYDDSDFDDSEYDD